MYIIPLGVESFGVAVLQEVVSPNKMCCRVICGDISQDGCLGGRDPCIAQVLLVVHIVVLQQSVVCRIFGIDRLLLHGAPLESIVFHRVLGLKEVQGRWPVEMSQVGKETIDLEGGCTVVDGMEHKGDVSFPVFHVSHIDK